MSTYLSCSLLTPKKNNALIMTERVAKSVALAMRCLDGTERVYESQPVPSSSAIAPTEIYF